MRVPVKRTFRTYVLLTMALLVSGMVAYWEWRSEMAAQATTHDASSPESMLPEPMSSESTNDEVEVEIGNFSSE